METTPLWLEDGKVNEVIFCNEFLSHHPMECVGGQLFTVEGPVEDEDSVRREILSMLETCITSGLAKKATGLLDVLKLRTYREPRAPDLQSIHTANGVYSLTEGFRPVREFCANRLAVCYEPDAPKPERWLRFLGELLEEDDILTLQEYLGYCLIPSTKGQKMMMILGRGGEGKSRIGLVMRDILGSSMNTGSIQKIENNRFARADLQGKLLLVDDDMDLNALPKTNYLKSIVTAESRMDIERKGQQSTQCQLYARFLAFGNGALTSLYDQSHGFYRRQLILTTKDRPADRQDDPFLTEKLRAEREGIFLWCLDGLHRLLNNGYRFTVSDRAAENLEAVQRTGNNLMEFLSSEGYIRFRADYEASSKDLYDAYRRWCEDNACHALSANRLSSELAQNQRKYNVEPTNNIHLPGGRRVRGFVGIEVLPPQF